MVDFMTVIFALCGVLLSPLVLLVYGLIRQLQLLHREAESRRNASACRHWADSEAIMPSASPRE